MTKNKIKAVVVGSTLHRGTMVKNSQTITQKQSKFKTKSNPQRSLIWTSDVMHVRFKILIKTNDEYIWT